MKKCYQGVRIAPNMMSSNHLTTNTVINYPGVRQKGSVTKVVRKISCDGKVVSVFSWDAFVSEEQLRKESN